MSTPINRLNAVRELEGLLTEMSLGELSPRQIARLNEMLLADAELRRAAQFWLVSDSLIRRTLLVEASEASLGGDDTLCGDDDCPADLIALAPAVNGECAPSSKWERPTPFPPGRSVDAGGVWPHACALSAYGKAIRTSRCGHA